MLKTDTLFLHNLEFDVIVGILPKERKVAQPLRVDVELDIALVPAAIACDLTQTFDYGTAADELGFILAASRFLLIESAAFAITAYILGAQAEAGVPVVNRVRTTITKPNALAGNGIPGVTIERNLQDLKFPTTKQGDWTETLLFECKDSMVLRYSSSKDFPGDLPPAPRDYKSQELPLKRTGHHILRVLRI